MSNESNELDSIHVFPLWVTPLYLGTISSASSYVDVLESKTWQRFSSDNGYVTEDTYILNQLEFENLKKEIQKHLENYIHNVFKINNKVSFYITNSWGIKHQKGDWAAKHYHTNSLFSGVLYLKCSDVSGDIKFYKNLGVTTGISQCFDFEYSEHNMFNSTEYTITPQDNMILLFPSHLEHSVHTSNSKDSRFAISFNVFFKGDLGGTSLEKICNLKLV